MSVDEMMDLGFGDQLINLLTETTASISRDVTAIVEGENKEKMANDEHRR